MALAAGTTPLPTDYFAGYTSDGTNITIPIASISGLTAAEADAGTGNGSEVVNKLIETAQATILAADAADRPANLAFENATLPLFIDANTVQTSVIITARKVVETGLGSVAEES